MEDGDGIVVPSQGDVPEEGNIHVEESEDTESSKFTSVRENLVSNSDKSVTDVDSLKNLVGFSNVNGDCIDKNSDVPERNLASSPTNSLSSIYSETTRDSTNDENIRNKDEDSGSENGSKSSSSEASTRERKFNVPIDEDSHHMSSDFSASSSDSDSSDSEDTVMDKDDTDFSETKLDLNPTLPLPFSENKLDENPTLPASFSEKKLDENLTLPISFSEKKLDENPNFPIYFSEKKLDENPTLPVSFSEKKLDETPTSPMSFNEKNLDENPTSPISRNICDPVKVPNEELGLGIDVSEGQKEPEVNEIISSNPVIQEVADIKNSLTSLSTSDKDDLNRNSVNEPVLSVLLETKKDNNSIDKDAIATNKVSSSLSDTDNNTTDQEEKPVDNTADISKDPSDEGVNSEKIEEKTTDDDIPEPQDVRLETKSIVQSIVDSNGKEEPSAKHIKRKEENFKTIKKKNEERVNISDLGEQFVIQYKGFKTTRTITGMSTDNKALIKNNPFNPAWKRNSKNRFGLFRNFRDEIDCSTLQPEYAQYLGLQPIVKFKCSNCGMSTFQTMSALNTHQVECKKNGKLISHSSEISHPPDVNSANIKLTRKVFLCSTCGTYYENCDLFLHMREFHRRYICLYCLFMAQSPEVLQEHLKEKHNITNQTYMSLEELQKHSPQSFFLLCLRCDRVFTEMDDSVNHKCNNKHSSDLEHGLFKKPRTDNISILESSNEISNLSVTDMSRYKASQILTKEVNTNKSNNSPHIAHDICYIEEENNESINVDITEKPMEVDSESNKNGSHDITFEAENLQLKVPSGIEIKPLVPGEKTNFERNEANRSSIEIFPITTEPYKKKIKLIKKTKKVIKKTIKKKPPNVLKIKAVTESALNILPTPETKETEVEPQVNLPPVPETIEHDSPPRIEVTQPDPPLQVPSLCNEMPEIKRSLSQEVFKIKLPGEIDSDGESDDSHKLSLVVDENTNNSDSEFRRNNETPENGSDSSKEDKSQSKNSGNLDSNEITLAREDVATMALTLDDKIENVPIQAVVKECVRTSCLSCNYCRHACKIAVNGKQLALHLLSEHRYTPVKNETHDDVVRKISGCLDQLENMYFNTETYDSSDTSIHIPYDQEKNYDCFQCSYVSSSHKDLYAHKKKCHTKSLLLCIMCKSNFYSYSELICHICPGSYFAKVQFHNVDLIFRCCFCRLDTIPSAFRLMVHLRKSHHTCDICLEMCSDQQKLSTHMWKHKLNHLCYRCGIAYASKPDITKHLFWKHGTESVLCKKCLQKKWPHVYHFCIPPTSFICEECNTSFSKAVALKVHKRIHGNDYPYSCDQCEKKYVSKKLLSRHIERHNAIAQRKEKMLNSPQEDKEEIINVTDLNDGKECSQNENSDANKETDGKDKGHKKHKKERERKEKKVVDVYDLPPLNLSSESDSSDEEEVSKKSSSKEVKDSNNLNASSETKLVPPVEDNHNDPNIPKLDDTTEDKLHNSLPMLNDHLNSELSDDSLKPGLNKHEIGFEKTSSKPSSPCQNSPFDNSTVKEQVKIDEVDETQNDQVEGIWENFYKTNPQNSKLPFPLCAMKSEVAYSIIMGDHDYCQQAKIEPVIKEDLPSASNLVTSLSDDKLEEVTPIIPEKPPQTPPLKEQEVSLTPTSMSKKKLKSPRKKISKTPDDNNSSSSSDSSSDSDTSSCSCGTNCSCSSSSSNSSSSSSSDSDSSTNEDKSKQDKRKKRKDKRIKQKSESELEVNKETLPKEPEPVIPIIPDDPPIRESELETDETTSDEEFYDRQPQIIANQMLAEKRNLVLLATGTPVNNGNTSPTIVPSPQEPTAVVPPPPEPVETPKQKTKPKRKRKITITPKVAKTEKTLSLSDSYPKFLNESKQYSPFQQGMATPKHKPQPPIPQSPSLPEAGGSGSETDNTRLSKRRRVPNKFYGYSSGDEEETPKQAPKWRKLETQMTLVQTPKIQPNLGPPTPRIQLTVPKQVIRKPTYHKASMKSKQHSTSESSDSSGSDVEERLPRPVAEEPIKAEKDVYCYCRCPYDEVSEMIACDDANCKIEWFHFECVGILVPPRGQWFCPGCRKARGLPT
ncbi:uncharacterized protein [Halyomorpha halys]|uniref:uncharacterized protein n=1 Tax=Halyomorpha halys TaxID=286706 RepID=UPI0006D4C8E4|nr:uncharacterized protein LOC106683364 [Halyomorpha halys]